MQTGLVHAWCVSTSLLRIASTLVPRASRVEWHAEWQSELWHVGEACDTDRNAAIHGEPRITAFCAGAFQDALALRLLHCSDCVTAMLKPGTATRCTLLLGVFFAISMLCSLCLPNVRAAMLPHSSKSSDNLAFVTREGYLGDTIATMRFDEYRAWKANTYEFAKRLVFYSLSKQLVRFGSENPVALNVADASQSMLNVLSPALKSSLPISHSESTHGGVLVSREVWREYLKKAKQNTGRTIEIAGRPRQIIGVSSEESWPVPGNMDVILLEDDTELSTSSRNALGFILAPGIGRAVYRSDPEHPYVLASGPDERVIRYECATLAQRRIRPSFLFLLALVLACMALPATTPLALGEYSSGKPRRKTTSRLRRLVFLLSKAALVIATVYFASLTLAYAESTEVSPSAEYLQLLTAFFGLLFALRWVIRDQRGRCPECLCLLTRPAHVGHASRIFLEWHGTEMLCSSGHGLLYIPEHPTSWFGIQRWQSLDASWASLFSH